MLVYHIVSDLSYTLCRCDEEESLVQEDINSVIKSYTKKLNILQAWSDELKISPSQTPYVHGMRAIVLKTLDETKVFILYLQTIFSNVNEDARQTFLFEQDSDENPSDDDDDDDSDDNIDDKLLDEYASILNSEYSSDDEDSFAD